MLRHYVRPADQTPSQSCRGQQVALLQCYLVRTVQGVIGSRAWLLPIVLILCIILTFSIVVLPSARERVAVHFSADVVVNTSWGCRGFCCRCCEPTIPIRWFWVIFGNLCRERPQIPRVLLLPLSPPTTLTAVASVVKLSYPYRTMVMRGKKAAIFLPNVIRYYR